MKELNGFGSGSPEDNKYSSSSDSSSVQQFVSKSVHNGAKKIRAFEGNSVDDNDDLFDDPLSHSDEYVIMNDEKVSIDAERWGSDRQAAPSSDNIRRYSTVNRNRPTPSNIPKFEKTQRESKPLEYKGERYEQEKRKAEQIAEKKERFKTDDIRAVDADSVVEKKITAKPIKALDYVDKASNSADMQGLMLNAKHYFAFFSDKQYYKKLIRRFESGRLVLAGDFTFLLEGNEMMAWRYNGISTDVEIPAKVGGCPVRYVSSDLFNDTSRFSLGGYKLRGVNSMISGQHHDNLNRSNIEELAAGIQRVLLPSTLIALPEAFLAGCDRVKIITIPDSVRYVSPKTFVGSNLDAIFFEGYCPTNMNLCSFSIIPSIYVRADYEHSFTRLQDVIMKFTGGC